METKEIIVDTNAILFGLKYNKNIFEVLLENEEYSHLKILISKGVIRELKKFSLSSKKLKIEASIAINIIQNMQLIIDNSNQYVDSWILSKSLKGNVLVCTNDIKLKRKLKSLGVGVISITKTGKLR
ncbi:MAG: hypothetical protein QXD23_02690 [Candidatus Micrarchaeaceae archaeon]